MVTSRACWLHVRACGPARAFGAKLHALALWNSTREILGLNKYPAMYNLMTEEQPTSPAIPVRCAFDEMVVLSELKPNPRNPNTHPPGQLKLLAKIIEHQGWWVVPVGEVGFVTLWPCPLEP